LFCNRFILISNIFFKKRNFAFYQQPLNFEYLVDTLKKVPEPIMFMIFPENKRYNCKSQEIITLNKKFSTEHNLPDFTHVLIPKIEITHACLCSFLSKLNCVYDVTIAYRDCTKTSNNLVSQTIPSYNDLFKNESKYEIHVHMKRISKEELIQTDLINFDSVDLNLNYSRDKTAQFLINLFYKKENNLDIFYRNDLKSKESDLKRVCSRQLSFKSILPGFIFYSSFSIFLLNFKLGRRIFIRTYSYSFILTLILNRFNAYFGNK